MKATRKFHFSAKEVCDLLRNLIEASGHKIEAKQDIKFYIGGSELGRIGRESDKTIAIVEIVEDQ